MNFLCNTNRSIIYTFLGITTISIFLIFIYYPIIQKSVYSTIKYYTITGINNNNNNNMNLTVLNRQENLLTCRLICEIVAGVTDSPMKYLQATNHTLIPIKFTNTTNSSDLSNTTIFQHVIGGSWMFKMISDHSNNIINNNNVNRCSNISKSGVAIIFMCKNRWPQLYVTLSTVIPLLQRQQLCYRIFVIEPIEHEAKKYFEFNCVVLHDADLAPLDDRIPYGCDEQVKQMAVHLSVGRSTENFTLMYQQANGFSNYYWGWGAEDDDFEIRLRYTNIKYIHFNASIARYLSVPHTIQSRDRLKYNGKLKDNARSRMKKDGLNSLKYKVINISNEYYFTHIFVSIKRTGVNQTQRSNTSEIFED
uniref:Beta-1,4-galactosyltransferase n=1 Tax=Trichobilharzia regenti TaxID=157069 RepID=A0AA85KLK4_TRIRE|nr:unnamed protein product [Trichobilharzia regenti]